jgi:hypothetical protein
MCPAFTGVSEDLTTNKSPLNQERPVATTPIHISPDGTPCVPADVVARKLRINVTAAQVFVANRITSGDPKFVWPRYVTRDGVTVIIEHFQPYLSKREQQKLTWLMADFDASADSARASI